MNNVEHRPRRRRDSDSLRRATSIPEPSPEPAKSAPALSVVKPPKRKFAEKDPELSLTPPLPSDLKSRFSELSARAAEAAKHQMESESPLCQGGADNPDTPMAEAEPVDGDSPTRSTLPKINHARRLSASGNIPSLAARKALGPSKSRNGVGGIRYSNWRNRKHKHRPHHQLSSEGDLPQRRPEGRRIPRKGEALGEAPSSNYTHVPRQPHARQRYASPRAGEHGNRTRRPTQPAGSQLCRTEFARQDATRRNGLCGRRHGGREDPSVGGQRQEEALAGKGD